MSNFINDSGSVRTTPSPAALIPSPRTESVSSPASTVTKDDDRIFIPNGLLPFHQDFAALKSYYSEIEVVPPLYNYVESIRSNSKFDGRWTVKMGDVVAVHYRQGAGRISFGSANESDKDTHFPYTVPWAIAEVVTIWREYDSVDEMNKSKRKRNACAAQDDVKIELRWFYRKGELPGAAKTVTVSENATKHLEYEEIFETDLMDHCDATSLLSPAKLHESAKRCGLSKMQQGMPLIDVHCCQFFSIHRKALLPIGGMSGRIERGRMHSKYFGKGGVLNLAWNDFKNDGTTENKAIPSIHAPQKWKQAFKEVIERLGLSAASDDASVQGIQLTGREAEQEKIMTFLRSRIAGSVEEEDDDDDSEDDDESAQSHVAINASLFIAGPPGTGKTASVLSVIARLRKEQANGKIPEFDFVSLNGMEMRHPFEAYVKFWEMISGPSKQKCPPEVAVAKLERHFAGRGGTDEDDKNSKQIVVLLLDEIDYLVTKKQTVLYNFFDWPRRTCENGCGPRLIVVGISNTLNLPSRLKPSVQSRLGSETCGYKSYNVKDMIAILKTKIQSDKAVSDI
jgi:origin recognition complex subunit 1